MIQGGCLCGAVRFEFDRAAGPFELCHCNRCRKTTGSAYAAEVGVRTADFRWLRGRDQIAIFSLPVRDEPPPYARSFCKLCGCVTPWPQATGEWTAIPAGLIDGDADLLVDRHIFVEHRPRWTPRGDGLPGARRARAALAARGQQWIWLSSGALPSRAPLSHGSAGQPTRLPAPMSNRESKASCRLDDLLK